MDIEYRRLLPTESLIYRYIRLECLKDFPEAFGTKYENAILQEKTGFQLSIENSDELKFVVGAFDDKIIIGICAFERNNMLGNIVQKVSTTLNDKISSGELKHEELIGEAMSMMNLFGGKGGSGMAGMMNNPLFSQMMKGMKSGKAGVRQDVISKATTRDRLRKKLESRNKNKNVE